MLHSINSGGRLSHLSARRLDICAFIALAILSAAVPCRGQTISANPSKLSFTYTPGGASPAPQSVSVSSSGSGLAFVVRVLTPQNSWLDVNPARGTTPATFTVSVTPAGLAPGTYQGTLTITPGGVVANLQNFSVTLTVNGPGTPVSNSLVNASGGQTRLAPGALFAVTGISIGPDTPAAATAPDYPKSLGGTSINFTPAGGGSPVDALIKSASASQVVGLVPSSIAPGTYAVRVSYKGVTSDPQSVTIVARSFGATTVNGLGTGPAQATIANVNNSASLVRFTSGSLDVDGVSWTLTPAHPGDTIELTGTGGGADLAADSGSTSGDQTADGNFIVTAGGLQITPLYAGAVAGSPGIWKISFTLPSDIPPDCFASVQVSAGGEVGNVVSIPIAAAGESACSDPQTSPAILSKLDAGGDVVVGSFGVVKVNSIAAGVTTTSASVAGAVLRYTASEWILSQSGARFEYCRVYDRTFPRDGKDPAAPEAFLDAGARLLLSGSNVPPGAGLGANPTPSGPFYLFSPAGFAIANGTYTVTGNGGSQVGPFSVSTNFQSAFTVTNWDSVTAIDRSQPLTFNWTGSGFDQVVILAGTATVIGANQHLATITCIVPGSLGGYSVPTAALAYLQPAPTSTSFGTVTVTAALSTPVTFTAPLAAGGQTDIGYFSASFSVTGKTNIPVR
jgi:uncharacterized protein (TIGR03437 family)